MGCPFDFKFSIKAHFESNIEALKHEHSQIEKHFHEQIHSLQDKIQELMREKTHLMHQASKAEEILKHENKSNANILYKSAVAENERQYKNSIRLAYNKVEQIDQSLKEQTRSHKNMQLNYGFKRWLMFAKMTKLLRDKEQQYRSEIDEKTLKIVEKFV